jgi:hypothetical protein
MYISELSSLVNGISELWITFRNKKLFWDLLTVWKCRENYKLVHLYVGSSRLCSHHKLIVYRTWSWYLRSINRYLYHGQNFTLRLILLIHIDCLPDGICPFIASEGDSVHFLHVYSLFRVIGGYFKSYIFFIKLVLKFFPVFEEHGMKTLEWG